MVSLGGAHRAWGHPRERCKFRSVHALINYRPGGLVIRIRGPTEGVGD